MIVSFDFDDTLCDIDGLPIDNLVNELKRHHNDGDEIIIVTARRHSFSNHQEISLFIQTHKLPVKSIHYTNHQPKGPFLKKLNASIHYDDSYEHCESARENNVIAYFVLDGNIVDS